MDESSRRYMTLSEKLKAAKPLSEWKMRNGEKFVFGAYNPDALIDYKIVGWAHCGAVASRGASGAFVVHREDEKDIIGPWPAEPVVFETTISLSDFGDYGFDDANYLKFLLGKRVKVTVQEVESER